MSQRPTLHEVNTLMIDTGQGKGAKTAFERSQEIRPCPYGEYGTCCKLCALGPCRINPKQAAAMRSICGVDANTIAARNFARMIAAGSAAHGDHAREVAKTFIAVARNELPGYGIKDESKLRMVAEVYGISMDGKSTEEIAEEVGRSALAEFGQQEGELAFVKRAPEKRQTVWRKLGIAPRGVDREVAELMHRTGMGTDQEYRNIMLQASRCALADGWGGSMIATELQDILFGTPGDLPRTRQPARGKVNLGVLEEDEVNIVLHGHEPILSEAIVLAAQDKELVELARSKGAQGINLAGLCCTANEVLIRHGIPVAGNNSQQELAVLTGAVEAMVVDVQCVIAGLADVASCYHTKLITTSPKAKIPGATHIQFDESNPLGTAKEIVRQAILNYSNREEVFIPQEPVEAIVGFSHEYIKYMQGGSFRASYRPLNDNIINGRILGVAGVVGCERPYLRQESISYELLKELIANNVLVVETGCCAIGGARDDLMTPEAAHTFAGDTLAEVCEALGIPPVLHAGSCVDNSRILIALTEMVHEGGLGEDIGELPVAGCCPDWVHEKALAIGHYFVASGVYTVFGPALQVTGAGDFSRFIYGELDESLKGSWGCAETPEQMANLIIEHIKKKRKALGLVASFEEKGERVLFDMEMRRALEAA